MKVDVIRAWPQRFESVSLELPDGSTVADALAAARLDPTPVAVFGVRAELHSTLADGDRVEVLRPLLADPKQARRRRAEVQRGA